MEGFLGGMYRGLRCPSYTYNLSACAFLASSKRRFGLASYDMKHGSDELLKSSAVQVDA
jgi:hypothetical protein